ncbi:MAG: hypothetical protein AB8B84_07885 [Granulosicoccus sp.]
MNNRACAAKHDINNRLRSIVNFIGGCVLVFQSACSSDSNTVPIIAAVAKPIDIASMASAVITQPGVELNDNKISLATPRDPLESNIELPNADAEAATENGLIAATSLPSGLSVQGNCFYRDSQIAASNGKWRFELAPGCSITLVGQTLLSASQAISLNLDAQNFSSQKAHLLIEVLAVGEDNSLDVLNSRHLFIDNGKPNWEAVQLISTYGQHAESEGKKLGLRVSNLSDEAVASIDEIQLSLFSPGDSENLVFTNTWDQHCNQLWAGRHFWSNRLQDWHVMNQRLETHAPNRYQPQRTTHRIASELSRAPAPFTLSVDTGAVNNAGNGSYSGFLIGAGGDMDYRSASLVHNRHGHNGGIVAGINNLGQVFIRDNGVDKRIIAIGKPSAQTSSGISLQLDGTYHQEGFYTLNVYALNEDKDIVSSTTTKIDAIRLRGNIALVSTAGVGNTAHWFDNWMGAGSKLRERTDREFGPVLFASYTLNVDTLTLNAQYPPLCTDDMADPTLEVLQQGSWNRLASATIDPDSFTARFVVNNWDAANSYQYRVVTQARTETDTDSYFQGVVQKDPVTESEIIIGLYNCRPGLTNSSTEGWIQQNFNDPFTWTRDRIVFPHEELINNSLEHDPHLVAFVGDQIYEFDPNGLVEKEFPTMMTDYLWKWFQFGWSARELMRNTPSFVLPDDHDVYQGNIWGQSGVSAENEEDGGYVYPAAFVNMVQRTQAGSLPDPVDGAPVNQGINVYFTSLTYGGVGIAILEDRKFKTGPFTALEDQQLLGDRQHRFLESWAEDWTGQSMKLAVSQSPFSQSTTHSGQQFKKMKRDWDSNGWPKAGRDQAVSLLRKAFAPHISGDQHLGLSLKHGVANQDDAVYEFAGPSMLNIFPRVWDPLNEEDGPGDEDLNNLGAYRDIHGNLITVLAAANPSVYYDGYDTSGKVDKNSLGIGYGMVRVNKPNRQFTFEAWAANTSPSDITATPYPGWPITIDQTANDGRIPSGFLIPRVAATAEPIVKVFNELDSSLIYARRYSSPIVDLPVYDSSLSYRVQLLDDNGYFEEFTGQLPQ